MDLMAHSEKMVSLCVTFKHKLINIESLYFLVKNCIKLLLLKKVYHSTISLFLVYKLFCYYTEIKKYIHFLSVKKYEINISFSLLSTT